MKKSQVSIFLILILGAILRCLWIAKRGITYDDAFSLLLARQNLADIISGTAADTMPPLFYFLLHFWLEIFDSIWWSRILGILLNLGGILLFYFSVRELSGENAAKWATVFAVVSPLQIYHAQDIRMYSLLQFTQVAYLYCFILLLLRKKTGYPIWVFFILSGVSSLYVHNLAGFFLLVPNFILLIQRKWCLLFKVIGSQIIMGVLFIPWIIHLPGQIEKIQTAFWTPRPSILEITQAIILFFGSLTLKGFWLALTAVLSLVLFLLVVYFLVRLKSLCFMQKSIYLPAIFLSPLLLLGISYLMRPVFVPRAFLVSSLFFYAATAVVALSVKQKWVRYSFLAMPLVIALISLPNFYLFDSFPRSPYKEALSYIDMNGDSDLLIIHDNKLSYFPCYVYNPGYHQVFLADAPGSANDTLAPESQMALRVFPALTAAEAVGDEESVYFILFQRTIDEYIVMGFSEHPVLNWFSDDWSLVTSEQVNDLLVMKFRRVQ